MNILTEATLKEPIALVLKLSKLHIHIINEQAHQKTDVIVMYKCMKCMESDQKLSQGQPLSHVKPV